MEEGQRQVWQMQTALPEAPAHKITVKSQDAMPTGQTGGAEAASQPEWLVHIEAEPRVRSGEALRSGRGQQATITTAGICPSHHPVAHPALQS